jgi:hypothetical protein
MLKRTTPEEALTDKPTPIASMAAGQIAVQMMLSLLINLYIADAMVDGSASLVCRIFGRLRPVRIVSKRGAICLRTCRRAPITDAMCQSTNTDMTGTWPARKVPSRSW